MYIPVYTIYIYIHISYLLESNSAIHVRTYSTYAAPYYCVDKRRSWSKNSPATSGIVGLSTPELQKANRSKDTVGGLRCRTKKSPVLGGI